ncbi:MAG: glycoside hydrolase family protein [Patescibacteria group bacterium]
MAIGISALLFAKAAKLETLHEGRRAHVYLDSKGIKTVGIGLNLERGDARSALDAVGADYDAIANGHTTLSNEQIDELFRRDLTMAIAWTKKVVPEFDNLPEVIQLVLIDMTFNMGWVALRGFPRMLAAMRSQNWEQMIAEMYDSKWFRDVPTRVNDDVRLLRAGLKLPSPVLALDDDERERIMALVALTTEQILDEHLEPHASETA